MNLVRWDPFRELEWMHARLNRMFSERPFRGADETELSFADWAPAADVQETEKEYVIKADLPDVKKDDVKVEYDDGVLTVEGERKLEREDKGTKYHKIERGYGKFVRRFALPTEVDTTKVTAEFKDGVLNVHLPKSPNDKRAIAVRVA
jgi:HSP20 family protein